MINKPKLFKPAIYSIALICFHPIFHCDGQNINELMEVKRIYDQTIHLTLQDMINAMDYEDRVKAEKVKIFITLDNNILGVYTDGSKIYIDAAALLYVEGLAIASAWYEANARNTIQPIANYTLLARKYYDDGLSRNNLLTIFEALQLPRDEIWALDDAHSIKIATRNYLNSAIYWMIGHELGHIVHGDTYHPTDNLNIRKAREIFADNYASQLLIQKFNMAPIGMAFTMFYYTLFNDSFVNNTALSFDNYHPIWPNRLEMIIENINDYGTQTFHNPSAFITVSTSFLVLAKGLQTTHLLEYLVIGSEGLNWTNIESFNSLKYILLNNN